MTPRPEHKRYAGYICIPYLGHDGRVLTMRFRCSADHKCKEVPHPKYQSLPGDHSRVFNIKALHEGLKDDSPVIHIAEGEFDAMILEKVGLHAIALPGASQWRPYHARMIAGFDKVFLWGDGDEAGQDFNRQVMENVRDAIPVGVGKGDVTDLYLSEGKEGLLSLLEGLDV